MRGRAKTLYNLCLIRHYLPYARFTKFKLFLFYCFRPHFVVKTRASILKHLHFSDWHDAEWKQCCMRLNYCNYYLPSELYNYENIGKIKQKCFRYVQFDCFVVITTVWSYCSEKHKNIVFLNVFCVMMLHVFLCRSVC